MRMLLAVLFLGWISGCVASPTKALQLPLGFSIGVAVEGGQDARSLAMGEGGTLYIATRRLGRLYVARDEDGDGVYEQVVVLAEGLRMPNGVAGHQGDLYVAENHRIVRYASIESNSARLPGAAVRGRTRLLESECSRRLSHRAHSPHGLRT